MKNLLAIPFMVVILTACPSNNSSNTTSNATTLGVQIDREGRAAINTAVNKTFASDVNRGNAEDSFNQTDNSSSVAEFSSEIASNLAIYDALVDDNNDGNACGDNAITNRVEVGSNTSLASGADRYSLIAGVLADDQLYINSAAGGNCNQYLAAEITVLGTDLSNDCGGRTPSMDVIETTYSVVAAGSPNGVNDGVTADDVAASTSFPFLGVPK